MPPQASSSQLLSQALTQIQSIATSPIFANDPCAKCLAGLQVAKFLALAAPEQGSTLAVDLCTTYNFSSTCQATYGPLALGPVITQVVANADVGGYDGQVCGFQYIYVVSELNLYRLSPVAVPKLLESVSSASHSATRLD